MKKTLLVTIAAVLLITPMAHAQGAAQKRAEAAAAGMSMEGIARPNRGFQRLPSPRFSGPRSLVNGTIQYDAGAIGTTGQNSFCVGNQFDTTGGANPLTASGSLTQIQVSMVSVGGTAAFFSLFDQQLGTTANGVDSASIGGLAPGMNTFSLSPGTFTNAYVGATFLAGMWQFNTDVPAVASGSTAGQGFHGMSINDIVATQFLRPGTYNAVLRPSGNLLTIPVELTGFEIVDD